MSFPLKSPTNQPNHSGRTKLTGRRDWMLRAHRRPSAKPSPHASAIDFAHSGPRARVSLLLCATKPAALCVFFAKPLCLGAISPGRRGGGSERGAPEKPRGTRGGDKEEEHARHTCGCGLARLRAGWRRRLRHSTKRKTLRNATGNRPAAGFACTSTMRRTQGVRGRRVCCCRPARRTCAPCTSLCWSSGRARVRGRSLWVGRFRCGLFLPPSTDIDLLLQPNSFARASAQRHRRLPSFSLSVSVFSSLPCVRATTGLAAATLQQ
jgi:hypothetical protein